MRTIKITPFDLLLLLISLFLFCVCATDIENTGLFAMIAVAPIYAVFSYRIGSNFSFLIPLIAYIISFAMTKDSVAPTMIIFAAGTSFSILNGIHTSPDRAKSSAVAGSVFSAGIAIFAALTAAKLQYGIAPAALLEKLQIYFSELEVRSNEILASTDFSALGYTMITPEQAMAYTAQVFEIIIYLFPLYALMAPMLLGYLSASLTRPIATLCNAQEMFYGINFEIKLTGTSIAVYLICSLLTLFMSGPTAFALNCLMSLLSPGLMMCGIKQIKNFFIRKNYSKVAVFFVTIIATIVILILPLGLGSTILTFMGMFYCTSLHTQQLKR